MNGRGNREPTTRACYQEPTSYCPGRSVVLSVAGYHSRLTPAAAERLAGELTEAAALARVTELEVKRDRAA